MRKGRDGGKKKREKREKKREKTDGNSGHYVVCQQSTARTPTAGTPHARAKKMCSSKVYLLAPHLNHFALIPPE